MAEGDDYVSAMLRDPLGALKVEDLVMEAARDLVKDEIKRTIRKKLDEDPELRENIRVAIAELMEAKVREAYAMVKIGKCGVDLAIALVPGDLKEKIDKEVAELLEKEVSEVIGRIE